jgi:phytoene dehydrogenase-like protein
MSGPFDAVVIGGGVGGLVASIYLRRAGRSVLMVEALDGLGGACRAISSLAGVRIAAGAAALYAIDPRVIDELDLLKRGLTFALRDMPLAVTWTNGAPLILGRDPNKAAQAIAVHSTADAENYRPYRRELFAFARALRPWWWENARGPLAPRSWNVLMERLQVTSAAAYLNGWFESEALKAALAFDALAPFEHGSALALVWRAAQEMCGLQGAVAIPRGGITAFADALTALAKETGVEIRTGARAARLILDGNQAVGVELESGERVLCRSVLSSLSRRATLLDLAPVASAGFAETQRLTHFAPMLGDAHIALVLDKAPDLGDLVATTRIVTAERLDTWLEIDSAARDRRLPDELTMEVVVVTGIEPDLAPAGQHVLSVRIPGLPVAPAQGWPALATQLAERVVGMLERRMKNLRSHIIGIHLGLPNERVQSAGFSVGRLLSPYGTRIATPIDGLFLCGAAAEPVDAISGRGGRLAAGLAHAWLSRETLP